MICKGCSEDKKLVKSHIIPESFFRGLKDGDKPPRIHFTEEGVYPKKSPIGVYDQEILCIDCEKRFQDVDDYGYKVLIKNEQELEPLVQNGETVGYLLKEIDALKLKLFFMSILWRASISKHYFYSKVNLGKLEKKLKDLIWQESTGNEHDFSFVLAKFEGDGAGRTIIDPHQERWFNIRYYRFYMYGYVLYIKSDSQKTPEKWAKFIATSNDSIPIVSRGHIEESKEYPLLNKAVVK